LFARTLSTRHNIGKKCISSGTIFSARLKQKHLVSRSFVTSLVASNKALLFDTTAGLEYTPGKRLVGAVPHENKPIVVVFGWLGASRKNLQKYVDWYSERGYDTIDYLAPSMASAFITATIKTSHAAMKQLVAHYNTAAQSHQRDIVFHVLSLNGFYHYLFLLIEMRNSKHHSELLERVKGVIIDSAPARITFDILTRGFVGAVMGVFKHKPQYEHPIVTPVFKLLWRLALMSRRNRQFLDLIHKELIQAQPLHSDQLYLYSTADELIPHDEIEYQINVQKERGVHVQSHNFVVTPHVAHFRFQPKIYGKLIEDFLESKWKKHDQIPDQK
jgi:hypothetical protein